MIALVMAVAVFSHYVLDIPVHRADLALFDNAYKIGLGLYNYPIPAFLLEAAVLLVGLWSKRTLDAITKEAVRYRHPSCPQTRRHMTRQ
jgi:hypothetical protein